MHVERCCLALLKQILPDLDTWRQGLTFDIGVGTFDFYCVLFAHLGFRTVAVEPLPVQRLHQIVRQLNIHLVESCVSDIDGVVDIYVGSYNDHENLNVSSMRDNWWGSSESTKQVPSTSLGNLLASINPTRITCMKIDVEGMEYSIIRQFGNINASLLPKVLVFEYGGGGEQMSGTGGWSKELITETIQSLEILRNLGYVQAVKIDSAPDTREYIFNLQTTVLDIATVFSPQDIYGNFIILHNMVYPAEKIEAISTKYQDNSLPAPSVHVINSVFKRTLYCTRRMVGTWLPDMSTSKNSSP